MHNTNKGTGGCRETYSVKVHSFLFNYDSCCVPVWSGNEGSIGTQERFMLLSCRATFSCTKDDIAWRCQSPGNRIAPHPFTPFNSTCRLKLCPVLNRQWWPCQARAYLAGGADSEPSLLAQNAPPYRRLCRYHRIPPPPYLRPFCQSLLSSPDCLHSEAGGKPGTQQAPLHWHRALT